MTQKSVTTRQANILPPPISLPIIIEEDEDGGYVIECPILPGCYTQGDTLDEALTNIKDVIELIAEEEDCQEIIEGYKANKISFQTIAIDLGASHV